MAQDFKYVGAKKCKMCHNKPATGGQHAQWLATKHAKSMESLNAEEAKDPACIKCHSTVGSVDASLIAGLKISEGVSCESCHGPGGKYFPNAIMKSREASMEKGLILPTEDVCLACHNEESEYYEGFNFVEATAIITHPNPAK
ncbi:MAG: multiheme c-type cytochrome [Methylococcales bacterium]